MADCAALEMLCVRKGTGGSNPPLSAQYEVVRQKPDAIEVSRTFDRCRAFLLRQDALPVTAKTSHVTRPDKKILRQVQP